jgi:preprotein translocase subunit SecY
MKFSEFTPKKITFSILLFFVFTLSWCWILPGINYDAFYVLMKQNKLAENLFFKVFDFFLSGNLLNLSMFTIGILSLIIALVFVIILSKKIKEKNRTEQKTVEFLVFVNIIAVVILLVIFSWVYFVLLRTNPYGIPIVLEPGFLDFLLMSLLSIAGAAIILLLCLKIEKNPGKLIRIVLLLLIASGIFVRLPVINKVYRNIIRAKITVPVMMKLEMVLHPEQRGVMSVIEELEKEKKK